MTHPKRVITYRVVVQAETNLSEDLEEVADWAEEALLNTFESEGYKVQADPPTITTLRGKTLQY